MSDKVKRKDLTGFAKAVGEREVRVVASTASEDRHGDTVRQEGIDLSRFRVNPVVLFNHDHNVPIAMAKEIGVKNGRLEALVEFPPEGTSEKGDEVLRLVKAGIINATSVGFITKRHEARDDGGLDFIESELLEFSFVSVPANADALVIERGMVEGEEIVARLRAEGDAQIARICAAKTEDTAALQKSKSVARKAAAQRRARLARVNELACAAG